MTSQSATTQEARRLRSFLAGTAASMGCSPEGLERLAASMLGLETIDHARSGISSLNHDGSPIELCLTAGSGRHHWRIVADPAFDRLIPAERLAAATLALDALTRRGGAGELRAVVSRLLEVHLAMTPVEAFSDGVFWIAGGLDGTGAAIYLDARPHDDGWQAARTIASAILPDGSAASDAIRGLERAAIPSSFAIEGTSLTDARFKIYFRLRAPIALAEWGAPELADPRYLRFLGIVLRDAEISRDGLVGCLGFSLATGSPADSKIDVCGHCLPWDAAAWIAILEQSAGELGIALPPLASALESSAVAFTGLGIDRGRGARLNLYLKPSLEDDPRGRIERAQARAVRRLLQLRRDGHWEDYELPVGASDQWVSAFAGYALALVRGRFPEAANAASETAAWLERHRSYPAGWGYNAATGPDADSTAFALALRRELGLTVEDRDRGFLDACRRGGGFATYPTEGAWGDGHPDVTPLAWLAFDPDARDEKQLLDFLSESRLDSGGWPSYWWKSGGYANWAVAELLDRIGRGGAFPPSPPPLDRQSAFDLACATAVASIAGDRERALDSIGALLALETPSGGWSGEEQLRVVDPDDRAPWLHRRSRFYRDGRGTIVNAVVARALEAALRALA